MSEEMVNRLTAELDTLKKQRETAEGHTCNQLDAAIASVQSRLDVLSPPAAQQEESPPEHA